MSKCCPSVGLRCGAKEGGKGRRCAAFGFAAVVQPLTRFPCALPLPGADGYTSINFVCYALYTDIDRYCFFGFM